jgi:hypothetical protein
MSIVPGAPNSAHPPPPTTTTTSINHTHTTTTTTASANMNPSTTIASSTSNSTTTTSNQEEKISNQKPQQFSNLNVNDLLNPSFSTNSSHIQSNTNVSSSSSSLSNLTTLHKSSSTESLASNKPPSQNLVTQQQQEQKVQTVNYDEFNIYMWSVCKICNKSTKKLPMSPDTWTFSFAKFLELTFYATNYLQFFNIDDLSQPNSTHCCKHSLFQDHYQYFRFKNIVTVFSTSKISIRTLCLPVVVLKSNVITFNLFIFFPFFKKTF